MNKSGALPKFINEPEYYTGKQFMFIDISGFTPLCDKFIRESSYGAEKIGDLINIVFNPIIDSVYSAGGDVISFAGDALFAAVDKKHLKAVQDNSHRIIREQTIDKNLSIRIEMFDKLFIPNVINSENASCFCFAPHKQNKERVEHDPFPPEIYDIYKSSFKGELRAVPIFFIHIDEKYSVENIKPLLILLSENAKSGSVYINKIEYLDKGWMILLSAGSPVYSADAPVKMYELLSKFAKAAEKDNIPVQIGGTLQRGYCGIIGNEKRWEFTFLGSNVNLAARIAAKSEPYKIYTDSSFAESAKTMLKSISIGKKDFKGVGEREVFEISGEIRDKKNLFVGRTEEIKTSLNFFKGDRRAFVLINGPSGIGKTVLAEQIIQSLGYKNLIRFKGVYGEDTDNYLFKDVFGSERSSPAEIFQKFKAVFEPTLIYIDDLHFADEKSLFMFHRMINEGNPFVNFIVTTIGREKIKITPLSYYETLIIDLKPFDAKDIQAITKLASGIDISLKASKELQRTTGGNPLFITGILPYITKDIEKSGEVPYSLQEVILLKLNEIPGKGTEFVDGGSVYGDIFDHGVLKDVVRLKDALLKGIILKAEEEGLVRKSFVRNELEFSNTIIREIIYERLLKKKIDFFRIRIAEEIIKSKTTDLKKLYKALTMLFLAEDERSLDLALKLAIRFNTSSGQDTLRSILTKVFEFIKKTGLYSKAYDFIELFSASSGLQVGAGLTKLIEEIALKVIDWRNNEKLLLHLAKVIFMVELKAPNELLERYKLLKGEDKYYLWARSKTCVYKFNREEEYKTFLDIKDKFDGTDKIEFYIDLVWYSFFITGDLKVEKEGMAVLNDLEPVMPVYMKINFLLLKNTLASHRDNMAESKICLDKISSYKEKKPDDVFTILNDYAILYSNLAYEQLNGDYIKKALRYSEKAVKLLKDYQKISDLPLVTTNLSSFYLSCGFIKKAERTMLEGLYYGKDIDHPVEVPYTKSRIEFLTSASGAYKLSLQIAQDVINCEVGDIKSAAYTLRFLYGGKNPKDIDKAYEYAKVYGKNGVAKCYWEMIGILLSQAFIDNDIQEMKKIREKLISWKKFPQRQGMKFGNETTIEILGVMTGIKTDISIVEKRISDIEKLKVNFGLLSKAYYALGLVYKSIEMLKTAKKHALRMKHYPFVQRIEKELFRLTGDKYWTDRIRISDKKLEEMNKINTIEEFLGFKSR